MNYRPLGKTGLEVSEVGLGALELGAAYGIGEECGQIPSDEEAAELLQAAVEAGINLFDTAGIYGLSEHRIGRFLLTTRQRVIVTTKLNVGERNGQWLDYATELPYPSVRACVDHQVARSLRNLGIEAIDVMQLHGVPAGTLFDEITDALQAHLKAGRIRVLGASCSGEQIPQLAAAGCYSTAQLAYNLLDQPERTTGLALAEKHGFGVLTRIPLALGVLADRVTRLDADRRARFEPFLDDLRSRLPQGMTVPEAALRFILSSPAVSACIPGTRRARHIRENAKAGDGAGLPRALYQDLCRRADEGRLPEWTWGEHFRLDWPAGFHEKNLQYCRSVDIP